MARLNNYKGAVRLGGGLYPQGNNSFALLQAADVQVTEDDKRLDEVLQTILDSLPEVELSKVLTIKTKLSTATDDIKEGEYKWEKTPNGRFKIIIKNNPFESSIPYIDTVIVYSLITEVVGENVSNVYVGEKTILDAINLVNGQINIYSDLDIECKIILKEG